MIDGVIFTRDMVEELALYGGRLRFQSNSSDTSSIISKSKLIGNKVVELAENMIAVVSSENIMVCSPDKIYLANAEHGEGLFMFTAFTEIDLRSTYLIEPIDITKMFYEASAENIDMTGIKLTKGSKCSKIFKGFIGSVKADDSRIQSQIRKYVKTQEEVDKEQQEQFERDMKAFIKSYADEEDDDDN